MSRKNGLFFIEPKLRVRRRPFCVFCTGFIGMVAPHQSLHSLSQRKWAFLIVGVLLYYVSTLLDFTVALWVHWPSKWSFNGGTDTTQGFLEFINKFGFTTLTLLWIAIPGVFQIAVDRKTRYHEEDAGKVPEKRAYPTIEYDFGSFRYLPRWVLTLVNICHFRAMYEAVNGVVLRKLPGGFRDALVIKAVFQSFPQAVTQTFIWYATDLASSPKEAALLVGIAANFAVIAICPHSTPCFEETWKRDPSLEGSANHETDVVAAGDEISFERHFDDDFMDGGPRAAEPAGLQATIDSKTGLEMTEMRARQRR